MRFRIAALVLAALMAVGMASPAAFAEEASPTQAPELTAKGYVLVSTSTAAGWLPLPESGEQDIPIRQVMSDGTEAVNVIRLTPEGVVMLDSTCEGHDCVKQGEVTMENREERILSNMIICLPNQVLIELYTPDEVMAMVAAGAPSP